MINHVLDSVLDRTVVPGFSRVGFALRSRGWPDLAPDALAGRVVAITGANAGLGKAAVLGAAALGAHVRMLCRDRARGELARAELLAAVPAARIVVDVCDVSSLASVTETAARLSGELDGLHGLVHNAGLLPPARAESVDGHEITLATHVLGPHLLTALLLPLLRADGDARVVFVSSGGMYTQQLRVDDPEFRDGQYSGAAAYARTKRMQVVLAQQWAQQLAGTGVSVQSMHPGWAATPGVTESLPRFARLLGPVLRTPAQGADTVVWLRAAAEPAGRSGQFWHDRRARPTVVLPRTAPSRAQASALWQYCVDVTGADASQVSS